MAGKRMFGAVRRLPTGRWQARYRSSEGWMVPAPETFATKGAAAAWLAAAESDQHRGCWTDPRAATVTLGEYATEWLDTRVDLAPRTREIYAAQLRLHILASVTPAVPALAGRPLAKVTPELVRAWYAALREAKGASVAAKAYVRLRQLMRQAVDDDRIAKNPCRIERGGAEHHPEQRFATMEELYRLADAVADRYRAMVLVAGLGGLRRGELFALRRGDTDLAAGVVAVRRKRLRLASGEVIEGAPKSRAGRRLVALPAPVIAELDRHLRRFTEPGDDAYVFTSAAGVPIEASNFRDRVWLPATRRAGLTGLRFHDLRHSAGTLAAQTGATTKDLMARLGHASPQAAMVYQHASLARDVVIAERLAQMAERAGLAPAPAASAQTGADRHGQ
jgi:integrase